MATIRGTVDYPRTGGGEPARESVAFDPRDLVSRALATVEASAAARGIGLQLDVAVGVPARVTGDATSVGQILLALLDNALKFTPSGYVHVAVTYRVTGRELAIAVTDTGIGVASNREGALFAGGEPMAARSLDGPASGLAACQRLAESMHGAIGVQSVLGFGSTFWFTAPVVEMAGPRETAGVGGG